MTTEILPITTAFETGKHPAYLPINPGYMPAELPPSPQERLDQFFASRERAQHDPGVRDERLMAIRNDVRTWFYGEFPDIASGQPGALEDYQQAKYAGASMIGRLVGYLQDNHVHQNGMTLSELFASQDFLDATFALNEAFQDGVDMKGKPSHAFVVPVRLGSERPEYVREIRPLVPVFEYVPDDLAHYFMRDLPAFIADTYKQGGYVMVASVTDDMRKDLAGVSQSTFITAGRRRVNDTVNLGAALGATKFGYGATFPGLMKWGEKTENAEVDTTTGHGGTTALMMMLMESIGQEFMDAKQPPAPIGILGMGRMGLPVALAAADLYPDSPIMVYDPDPAILARLLKSEHASRFIVAQSEQELIEANTFILSTAGCTFNLTDPNKPKYIPVQSMEGKFIIDDSEPHSFLPEEVLARGGMVFDVVGRDYSGRVERNSDFGYGGTLADRKKDAFGCELEVATLANYARDLEAGGWTPDKIKVEIDKYALRRPITPEDTRNWMELFKRYHIGPAPFQVFGKFYEREEPGRIRRAIRGLGSLISSVVSHKIPKARQPFVLAS